MFYRGNRRSNISSHIGLIGLCEQKRWWISTFPTRNRQNFRCPFIRGVRGVRQNFRCPFIRASVRSRLSPYLVNGFRENSSGFELDSHSRNNFLRVSRAPVLVVPVTTSLLSLWVWTHYFVIPRFEKIRYSNRVFWKFWFCAGGSQHEISQGTKIIVASTEDDLTTWIPI